MTKKKISAKLRKEFPGFTGNQLSAVVDSFFNNVRCILQKKQRIEIRGFGVFKVTKLAQRRIPNPILNKTIVASEKYRVRFKEGSALCKKEVVNI